jgi:hypothetical protein
MLTQCEPISELMSLFPSRSTISSVTERPILWAFFISCLTGRALTMQVRDKTGHGMRINLDIDETLSIKSVPQKAEV